MSSAGGESPPDEDEARERSGRRRDTKRTLKGSGFPSTDHRFSGGTTSETTVAVSRDSHAKIDPLDSTENNSRPSTPELASLDATSALSSAHDLDVLPFPLSPHPLTRGTWRNLSIIFEGSESTNSLSNEDVSNKSASTSSVSQSKQDDRVGNVKRFKNKGRYSLPNISSLVSKTSKSSDSTKTSVADKIAYFEQSLRKSQAMSTSPSRLKSFLPNPKESRRRSLPSILKAPSSPSSLSSVSFPTRPSHSDESSLGTKLYSGFLWYLNVHGPGPPKWILCNASLYRNALLLTWQTSGTTKATVTLDLLNCLDVQSTPTVSDPSVASDVGAIAWIWDRERVSRSIEDIYPMHLQFDDGVERIATSTLIDRVTWVGTILEYLPLNRPRRDRVVTPHKRVLSPLPDSNSVAAITLPQEPQGITTAASITRNPIRPTNGHSRTRSTGDVPKVPQISKETQRKPLLRRISSMSNILSTDSSVPSEFGYGYITAGESSTMSSVPSRHRSVSLKSVTSFLSRLSSRVDGISSDGSEPAAPVSPAPTHSHILLHSRSSSYESASVASEEAEGNSLGRLFRKRDASAATRLKKPKPRLPALSRLTIDPYRSFSVPQISTKLEGTVSASSTMHDLGDYSRSPTYHSAATSLTSTPPYHTASEGDVRETESLHMSPTQDFPQVPTSATSDSLFVTASNFTSSDAWMAHFSAASRPTSPKASSSRRRPHSGPSTPRTMSSSHTFSHLFNVDSAPFPVVTAEKTSSRTSVQANVGSTKVSIVSAVPESTSSRSAIQADLIAQANGCESPMFAIDLSSEVETQIVDYPPVPPPSVDVPLLSSSRLFSDTVSTLATNSTLGVAATASPHVGPSSIPNQLPLNELSTQLDITKSVQEVLQPTRFASLRDGDAEYEMTLVQSSSPITQSTARKPPPLLPPEVPYRKRVVPKRVVSRQRSDESPQHSSIFLPSRQPSIRSVTPNTPSSVEISLTPVQASLFPSALDTFTSDPDQALHPSGLEQDSRACEQRLNSLLEFVERTRAAQTETSAEFSEQIGRIESQLLELGRLIRETMATAPLETDAIRMQARPNALPQISMALYTPTIVSLSPPRSAFYDESTPTSAELQASITRSGTSSDVNAVPRFEPPMPSGDTSSSLHLSRFPDVPDISPHRLLSITNVAPAIVSNFELRDMIAQLSGSIGALVTRQQAFNNALESLQRRGVALDPLSLSGRAGDENLTFNILPRWTELLKPLGNFAQRHRGSHPDRINDDRGAHHFFDHSSPPTSSSQTGDVEILSALPILTGAVSLAYAHKLPAPRRRSQSPLPTGGGTLSSRESIPHPRARSAEDVVIIANEPNTPRWHSVEPSENDTLTSLVGVPFTPRPREPITRTWYRKRKQDRTRVHWATTSQATTDNVPSPGLEGDNGIDSGAVQVTRLLQESQARQVAASTQQDEIVRYLGELNDWLSRDAIDRRAELRGLGDRLDGIQRTMMYGPTPAISLAVPPLPLPFFTALSAQSNEPDAWPTAQEDDDPIIPPPPPKPRKTPAIIPVNLAQRGLKGFTNISVSTSDPAHEREGDSVITLETHSGLVPQSASRRSAGQRVTFATYSQEVPTVTDLRGPHTVPPSIIKVSGDAIASQPGARSFDISRDAELYRREKQLPSKDRRWSRSRVVKPLTQEASKRVVRVPDRQGKSSAKFQSPGRSPGQATASMSLNTGFETSGQHQPAATVFPSNYRADNRKASPVVQHNVRGVGAHTIPHNVRAMARPGFVEGRSGSKDRNFIYRQTSLSPNHRRRSRSTRHLENARGSRSPENVARRRGHYHETTNFRRPLSSPEPSPRQGSRRYKPRRSQSNSPQHQTVSPDHDRPSFRGAHPLILSPLPLRQGRPLPSILTEPTVVDLHQTQRQDSHHAAEGHSTGAHILHPPRVLLRQMPAPVYVHRDDHLVIPDASHSDRLPRIPAESQQARPLVTNRDEALKSPSELTSPEACFVHEAVSHQRSQPALSVVSQPRIPKPQGTPAKGSIQQQTAPPSLTYLASKPTASTRGVEALGIEGLGNVGNAETHLVPKQASRIHDTAGSAPTQVHQGSSKPKKGNRREEQAEHRLSAISEIPEPQFPSLASFEIIKESDQKIANSDSDYSEQTRDTIFLARQAERQRTLDESAQAQILAHRKFLADLQDPNLTKPCRSDPGTGTQVSSLNEHVREPAQMSPVLVTDGIVANEVSRSTIVPTSLLQAKGIQIVRESERATVSNGAPSLPMYLSVGIIADGDRDIGRLHPPNRPSPSTSRVTENVRSDNDSRISRLLQSLKDEHSPLPSPYSLELANERAKARRLEEEIQKTKDAIQAIKDERAAANEKRQLDTLTSISRMQDDMQGQLRSITDQLTQLDQSNPGWRTEEVPATSFEDDITGFVNRIHDVQLAERHSKAQDCSIAETRSAVARDVEQLRQRNEAQKALIEDMLGKTTKENQHQQALLLEAFKRASAVQVKANVNEQLHEFTGLVTHEVRILLKEVGNLREQRRNLQHEIGCLLCFRSKMEPKGEFDASWDPAHHPPCTHFPSPGAGDVPHQEAPGFVSVGPPRGANEPGIPVASTSRRTTAGNHNAAPVVHPMVVSPPPAYINPRPNNHGSQARAPRAANPPVVVGTSRANVGSTAIRPPPARASRKSRPKRPE